ncbi:DNA-binding protein Alba [archaeon]|nr:MAG: DNA-binding protein Alba [archaeon]RLG65225.1 MAG: DNA-binding protein Alba [archaeon]HDM24185.1 DNA-binding protein Alba [Candidatus Bathyarchaeota archaeon]
MSEKKTEEAAVYIGNKPVMNYVLACLTLLHGGHEKVSIKARGKAISRAVDVAEIVRKRFDLAVDVENIKIDTEELTASDGSPVKVSTIEIVLKKTK